jgi:hypothetical protein
VSPFSKFALLALLLTATGCNCGHPGDNGDPGTEADAGQKTDGGQKLPDGGIRPDGGTTPDGGTPYTAYNFPTDTAYEPCTPDSEGRAADGGMPKPDVYLPLCFARRTVSGFAQLNGAAVQQSVDWSMESNGYQSEYADNTDGGLYSFKVLRGDYTHY